MELKVHLSGEIHSDWRNQIIRACQRDGVAATFTNPITNHGLSDNVGAQILGKEEKLFWDDHKSAKINAIRIRKSIDRADVVVVKFGEKFKQWNAAFDAGYAAAKGKSIIVLHPENLRHALKEVDAAAMAVAETPEQVVGILGYVARQQDEIDS